jgi:hypothetical protein
MSDLGDLLGTFLGALVGRAAGSINNGIKDYREYTGSGQYEEDYSVGSANASEMSDRSLYKEMSNKNRSAGERLAYKDELKNRGY